MEAGRASVIIILELVTAVASALWIGGERMSVTEMVGGASMGTAKPPAQNATVLRSSIFGVSLSVLSYLHRS